jgi:hypothetical protein
VAEVVIRDILAIYDLTIRDMCNNICSNWECNQDFHCVLVTTFIIENNTATCTQKRWNHNNSIDVVILKMIYNDILIRFEYCKLIGWSAWRKLWLCSITTVGIVMSPTYTMKILIALMSLMSIVMSQSKYLLSMVWITPSKIYTTYRREGH